MRFKPMKAGLFSSYPTRVFKELLPEILQPVPSAQDHDRWVRFASLLTNCSLVMQLSLRSEERHLDPKGRLEPRAINQVSNKPCTYPSSTHGSACGPNQGRSVKRRCPIGCPRAPGEERLRAQDRTTPVRRHDVGVKIDDKIRPRPWDWSPPGLEAL